MVQTERKLAEADAANISVAGSDAPGLGEVLRKQPQRQAVSKFGMVATAHYCATQAGVEMLAEGGNAIDAAVAAALALGVCEPAASGLGGQTMILIHLSQPRRTIALDGSSRAPNRATAEMFVKKVRSLRGHAATTVPSTPAVLDYAVRHYGTFTFSHVAEPAIRLAEDGYPISELQHKLTVRELEHLKAGTAAPLLLKDGSEPYGVGATFKQPALAELLRHLASRGVKDFYRGQIAHQIADDMETHRGLIRRDDLAQIPRPILRKPLSCRFEGHRVLTFPPPAAGRTLVEMLQILQHFPPNRRDIDTPQGAILLAEIIRRAFLDRRDRPYEPNYYPQVADTRMMSQVYAKTVADRIQESLETHGETTHLSVMDRFGNVVALTQSIERVYGSFAATPQLGFLYNNYMSAFDYKNISHPYYLRPNAVPWASVAPTIIFRGRRPWLAIGSPGSERITPAILQVLIRLAKQSPLDAVDAPRLHCALDGTVSLEAERMPAEIPLALERQGFQICEREAYSFYLGCVQLVLREKDGFVGVADPRRDGSAGGPDR